MELRNHPLLSHRGLSNWPPVWVPFKSDDKKPALRGEIGTLKYTLSNALSGKCYLLIDHDNSPYIGCLFCDDVAFCSQIAAALEDNRGRTIKEIGDLDLSFTTVNRGPVEKIARQSNGNIRRSLHTGADDSCSF